VKEIEADEVTREMADLDIRKNMRILVVRSN
jgi:hypothetical protein